MADGGATPCIYVLAGTNGAGKSSIAGAMFEQAGGAYFNPDDAARLIRSRHPAISQAEANGAAWEQGRRLLERAIAERLTFAFETTLGGKTITALLERALGADGEVRIWYVGLSTPELHLARGQAALAGAVLEHDIPEAQIRARYDASRLNLIRMLQRLTELRVYDNSAEADPYTGATPEPRLLLHMIGGRLARAGALAETPEWAKPILAAALRSAAVRSP